jgi:hypothetical protein
LKAGHDAASAFAGHQRPRSRFPREAIATSRAIRLDRALTGAGETVDLGLDQGTRVMRTIRAIGLLVLLSASAASAQAPLDIETIDPVLLEDFLGDWSIQNSDGSKSCKVTLSRELTIGGLWIMADPDCAKVFPVMKHVAAWRLYEDWEIVLVDATRKSLIRFSAPDNAYIAEPVTDGITTIVKIGGGLEN